MGYRNRAIAIGLALGGILVPGLHKFYLRQPLWGLFYLLLGVLFSPVTVEHGSLGAIARIACVIEAVWYLFQGADAFDATFNPQITAVVPKLEPTPSDLQES
ncbi:hypothetical protein RYO59_002705 [Thermosynechococcaceae cyanobacterium Okahandja]